MLEGVATPLSQQLTILRGFNLPSSPKVDVDVLNMNELANHCDLIHRLRNYSSTLELHDATPHGIPGTYNQRSENMKTHDTTTRRAKKLLVGALILHSLPGMKSDPASPSGSSEMGYSGGGAQAEAAPWRLRRSTWAVGRAEGDSCQHRTTNLHSLSEKPNDLALTGFLGRFPFCTATTTIHGTRRWKGRRPVRT